MYSETVTHSILGSCGSHPMEQVGISPTSLFPVENYTPSVRKWDSTYVWPEMQQRVPAQCPHSQCDQKSEKEMEELVAEERDNDNSHCWGEAGQGDG